MKISTQTQQDLKAILEKLDQRIFELTGVFSAAAEVDSLNALRNNTADLLTVS
jgi:hypothetical protein